MTTTLEQPAPLAEARDSRTAKTKGGSSAPICSSIRSENSQQQNLNELHLFAGVGGGILGGILLGHRPCCAVEIEPYARKVLLQRQRDGILPAFPIWDDVTTFDGRPWRGIADIVCGGFPCQDISYAGNGKGIEGERSGLWGEMSRIIGEIRPRFALVENSAALTFRGLGRVLGDLAELGMDARWGVLGANHAGGLHQRARIWVVAYAKQNGWGEDTADRITGALVGRVSATREAECPQAIQPIHRSPLRLRGIKIQRPDRTPWSAIPEPGRTTLPGMGGVVNGVANGMERLAAIGNGQVPAVARIAYEQLTPLARCSNSDYTTAG